MSEIVRIGESRRWADVVIHRGVARWVEVAVDASTDALGQIRQVLAQIDETLVQIGSDRQHLLQITIFLALMSDATTLNALWDAWVPAGHPPVRACVQAGLSGGLLVEMIIEAAMSDGKN